MPKRLTAEFLTETLELRKEWDEIFKILKEKTCQPRMLYPVKLYIRNEGYLKTFYCQQKLKEFIITRLTLREILKQVIH